MILNTATGNGIDQTLFMALSPSNSAAHDFDALTRHHKDVVYRQLIRVCGNREDAEDVLVEALLKAYRHLDQLRESAAFRSWLTQVAKRVCRQLKEHEALLPLIQLSELDEEGREIPGPGPSPELHLARSQMKQFLDSAVASLCACSTLMPGFKRPIMREFHDAAPP